MYNIFPTTLWTIFQQILVLSPIPCLNHTMTKLSSLLSCIKSKQYTTQKLVGLLVVLKLKLGSLFILIVFFILTLSIMWRLKDSCRQTQPSINYPYITYNHKSFWKCLLHHKTLYVYMKYITPLNFQMFFKTLKKYMLLPITFLNIFKLLKLGDWLKRNAALNLQNTFTGIS